MYGDGGWGGQQAQAGQQPPYGGQLQHYPQQQQPQYGDWGGDGGQGAYGQPQYDQYGQQPPEPQYDQYGQQPPEPQYDQYGQQPPEPQYDQYGQQPPEPQYDQYGQQPPEPQYDQYGQPQYDQQYAAQAHSQQGQGQGQGHDGGGWGTGEHPHAQYPGDPSDPYGQQNAVYGAEQPDFYGTPEAYPPPEPPGRRRTDPEPRSTDQDPGSDEGEQAPVADGDAGDPDGGRGGRGERRGRGGKPKKGRSGLACLVVCLVLGGGVAGVGYFGLQFYQDRFGAAPDYAGNGNGEKVTVTIPKGAGGATIGQELKRQGVVKSVDAFISAQQSNPEGKSIQDGVYTLQKEMSAAAAVELLLSPASRSNLIIAEGWRNVQVYAKVDEQLGVKKGTTAKVAEAQWKNLGLPDWALNHRNTKDPLEGFLFPSSYPAAKGQKPEDVLKQMVARANERYTELGLESKAESLGLDGPWELLTVASMVQAEGKTHEDFRKMSEVIYNRLKPDNTETNRLLQFDSSYNYAKGQSNIHIGESEINRDKDPYNTYTNTGLPPGPISNPGDEALQASVDPTNDGWIYFVATDGMDKTEFAKNHDDFLKLKEKFNAS